MVAYNVSRFSVILPMAPPNEDLLAIFHTLTRALMVVPAAQWRTIAGDDAGADPSPELAPELAPDLAPDLELLVSQGILVASQTDEAAAFIQWKERHVHDFSTLRSKVLVTRQCNNRCTYCIIAPQATVMSPATARAMDDFYLEQIKHHRPEQVRDDFLGGEPLLNAEVIAQSAGRRFYFCQGAEIDYRFSITTNGTLIKPQTIERLKAVGLNTVRVSMAGPAHIHDTLRPLKNGAGTYAAIMKNLEAISGQVKLLVECQYDAAKDDYLHIPEMLKDLEQRRIPLAEINFTPILPKRGSTRFCSGMGDVRKFLFLNDQARQYGISPCDHPPSNSCMADFRAFYVFDTDGELIPCPSLAKGERAYGTVTGGIDLATEFQMRMRRLPDKCLQRCQLLPLCMGGCRLQALTRHGDFNGIDCHENIFRPLLEAHIRHSATAAMTTEKAAA